MHKEPILERMMVNKATQNHIPLTGNFELLPMCNMSCEMCFLRLSAEETRQRGGLLSIEEWLSIAKEMLAEGTLFLLLTGGEPFLYPDFISLYKELRKMGFIITINTNGTLLDETLADVLAKDKPRRVNITLYGTDDEMYRKICKNPHGYSQTIRAIRLLKERGIDTKLNVTLVPENVHCLKRFHEIAEEYNLPIDVNPYVVPACRERSTPFLDSARLSPYAAANAYVDMLEFQMKEHAIEHMQNQLKRLADYKKEDKTIYCEKMSCRAGRSSAWISWTGELIPCAFLNKPGYPVLNTGFSTAWKNILPEVDNIYLPPECSSCEFRCLCPICASFSAADAGSTTSKPEYMCLYTKHLATIMKERVNQYENESLLHVSKSP